jgi:Zn-dependent protease with chaperone function
VNWAGLAIGVGLAVVAAAVLYHVSVRRARGVAASASADRLHDLRVISLQMRRAAILGGFIGAACCFAPAHWAGTGRGPFIGSGRAIGTILVSAACLALPSMVVQRPVVAAIARQRDIPVKALRSYRATTARAIGVVVALWPVVLAIAVSASLTIKIIIVVAGYLVACPVLTGLLAPAYARLLAPGALPAGVEERLTRLAAKAGARARGRTIPARARKAAVVAMQLGWVPGLRFVLVTDYLVDELAPSDVDAVLAHELAHARHHDYIVRYMIRTVSFVLAVVALVKDVIRRLAGSLRSARLGKVGGPLRIAVVGGPDQSPVHPAGHDGHAAQGPAKLLDQPVGLAVVAAHAGGDAVLPVVGPAAAARHDMIDGLGLGPAVRTQVVVPAHQRGPGQRDPAAVRHPDIATEPDHGRGHEHDRG